MPESLGTVGLDRPTFVPEIDQVVDAPEAVAGTGGNAAAGSERPESQGPALERPSRSTPRPDYRARSGGYVDRRPFRPGAPAPGQWSRTPIGPPPSELLGQDEELVAGRHPVEEAFIARRRAIRLLVVPQRRQALERLVLHATNLRIPIVEVEGGTLTSLAGFDGHQGIALVTDRRPFASLDDILARAMERKEAPFVLVLDSLEDPQNFGSLLRTAEASGVHGVIYPVPHQAPLSAAAIKASAGAVEHLLLVPVEDLAGALADLHVRGLRIIGSDSDASLTAREADLRGPVTVVVGSEGQGLGPSVRRRCDTVVRIPMRGRVHSLNAAVAGSILLYEASSQRAGERPLTGPGSADTAADTAADSAADTAADSAAESDADTAAESDAEDRPAEPPEPEAESSTRPKSRRRSFSKAHGVAPHLEPGPDALLPGGSTIDPNGLATAE